MRPPYGIFAVADGEVKLIRETSVRFSRANWAAQQVAQSYPGVFFAHVVGGSPVGERHKPARVTRENYWLFTGKKNAPAPHVPLDPEELQRRNKRVLEAQTKLDAEDRKLAARKLRFKGRV